MTQESSLYLTKSDMTARLRCCSNLPSPPSVALRILRIGEDPDTSIADVARVVSQDPALASRILRVANSPLYARRRRSENIRQAVTQLGLNGTMTLALGFSLVGSLRTLAGGSMNYALYWRRSLMSATCAQVLGNLLGRRDQEELFLAGLLQDIGMLALDKFMPDLYRDIAGDPGDHRLLLDAERAVLGVDHSAVGAWLLDRWHLPKRLQHAVFGSHEPSHAAPLESDAEFVHCIAAAGIIADIWLRSDHAAAMVDAGRAVADWFDIRDEAYQELLRSISTQLPENEFLFDVELTDATVTDLIMDEAQELMMVWNLQAMRTADELQQTTDALESRTRELEERNRRDSLTGLFNRGFLDRTLSEEFERAKQQGWPLSIAFVDLDSFKLINDRYGHQAGDEVLRGAGRTLLDNTRASDMAARYGGEEFMILLPGVGMAGVGPAVNRLLTAFRTRTHPIESGEKLSVTVSIGVAVQGEGYEFESASDLVSAADGAVYEAKNRGRDRIVFHESAGNGCAVEPSPLRLANRI